MKARFNEAYQGWAATELGGFPTERVKKGVHEIPKKFADYLTKTFPSLIDEMPPDPVYTEDFPGLVDEMPEEQEAKAEQDVVKKAKGKAKGKAKK